MGANYDTEVERQKKGDFTANTVLPILAALETIATAKASRGQNVGASTLGLIKDTQSRREAALERAARADDAAFNKNLNIAESVRASKRLGMDEAEAKRRSATWEDADKEAQEKANTRKATIDRLLGIPNEYDEKTNTVTRSGVPGVPDLTEEDKAAIHADPIAWLTYRLKPQAVTYITGANGTVYEAPKTGGAAKVVKTEDGAPIVGQPKPTAGTGQPKAPAGYRYKEDGTLEPIPGGPASGSGTNIPGLTAIPGATITNNGVKLVQDIAVRKDELVNSIKRLQELYDKNGTQLYGDKAREMESLVKGIQLTAKEFYNLGVLNGPDLGLMETIIANPTGMKENLIGMVPGAGDPVTPKLKEAQNLIDERFKSTIKRYGFQEDTPPAPGAALNNAFPVPGRDPALTGAVDRSVDGIRPASEDPKKAMARQALNDPEATESDKAMARRYLAEHP